MLPLLAHWRYLAPATARLAFGFVQAGRYFRHRALPDLELPPPLAPDERTMRRWRHYFFGASFLCAVFCQLRGFGLRPQEIRRVGQLAALACFFDDLADGFKPGAGAPWCDNPEQYGQAADTSGFALHLLHKIYAGLPPAQLDEFRQYLHRVFNLETAGRQQQGSPGPGELAALTAEKGAASVLLFRRLLDHPLPEAERRALAELGCLIQLSDDIFDNWFDRQNGTATLATLLLGKGDPVQLRALFERQAKTTAAAFRQMPGSGYRRETALRVVHFLTGITRVCLRHYCRLQKKRGTLPLENRRAMVVDMDKARHRWHTAAEVLLNNA